MLTACRQSEDSKLRFQRDFLDLFGSEQHESRNKADGTRTFGGSSSRAIAGKVAETSQDKGLGRSRGIERGTGVGGGANGLMFMSSKLKALDLTSASAL